MKLNNKVELITSYLNELFKDAKCELIYNKDYEFLIAVMLSAQTTDKKVNSVTPILFSKYKTLDELNNAKVEDIENIIKPLGLYKNKAKNIKEISSILLSKYNGVVPKEKIELITLPGVGNKTSNVIRIELFKEQEFPVDTHVIRVSNRLGLVNNEYNPDVIEIKLKKIFKDCDLIKLHHQFIFFGRYKCKAKNPICNGCKFKEFCKEKNSL